MGSARGCENVCAHFRKSYPCLSLSLCWKAYHGGPLGALQQLRMGGQRRVTSDFMCWLLCWFNWVGSESRLFFFGLSTAYFSNLVYQIKFVGTLLCKNESSHPPPSDRLSTLSNSHSTALLFLVHTAISFRGRNKSDLKHLETMYYSLDKGQSKGPNLKK